ncbi:MAG: hypothetical protein U9P70_03850 [Patescibacteria group bacterium]|nr:hypothetical protein [Patescibacteria group bacterium]
MIDRKIKNYTFILFLFVFLQVTFIPQFFSSNYIPNVVLVLLLVISAFNGKSTNIFYIAFATGFVLDLFSGNCFGPLIISVLFAIFISSYLNYYFLKKIFSYKFFLISSFAVFVYNVSYIFLINISELSLIFSNLKQFLIIIVFQIIYTVILIYPLAYIFFVKFSNK